MTFWPILIMVTLAVGFLDLIVFIKKNKQIDTIKHIKQDLISYIMTSAKLVLKDKIKVIVSVVSCMGGILFVQLYLFNNKMFFPVILLILGACFSLIVVCSTVYFNIYFSSRLCFYFLSRPLQYHTLLRHIGRLSVWLMLSLTLASIFLCVKFTDICLIYDLFGIKSYFEDIVKTLSLQLPTYDFITYYYSNRGMYALFLFLVSTGYLICSVATRIYSAYFGTSTDIALDITSHLNYDYLEDDLRNPGLIADQIGDILKNGCSVMSSTVALVLLTCNLFFTYVANDVLFNSHHLITDNLYIGFIIFCISLCCLPLTSFSSFKQSATLKSCFTLLTRNQIIYGIGCVSLLILISKIQGISITLLVSIFIGQLTFYFILIITYYCYQQVNKVHETSSIFTLLLNGELRGYFITLVTTFTFLIGLIITFVSVKFISAEPVGIYGFLLFLVGFCLQLVCLLSDHLAHNLLDNFESIELITQNMSETKKEIQQYRLFDILLSTITKTAIILWSLLLSILMSFYYYSRIRNLLFLNKSKEVSNLSIAEIDMNVINKIFDVKLNNPEYIFGLSIGGLAIIFSLFMLVYGAYSLFKKLKKSIDFNVSELTKQPHKEPNYNLIIKQATKLSFSRTLLSVGVFLLLPFVTARLFGIAGLSGFIAACFPIIFLCDLFFCNSGNIWKFIKCKFNQDDNLSLEGDDYTSRTNQIFCDNFGDLRKDLFGLTISMVILFFMVVSILAIPFALRHNGFLILM